VALSLKLASEAALPARNFNDATRDRRFFPRLAVPPFLAMKFTAVAPCLISLPRLELGPNPRARCFVLICAWRGGRVVDCTALEMRHRCKPIGGSNPPLSATLRPDGLRVAGHPREEKGASDLHFKQLCPSFRDAPSRQNSEAILRCRRRPGIHHAAGMLGEMDSPMCNCTS
jgi:hypothetical protein